MGESRYNANMSPSRPELKFTYHDYLLLPEDKQYELIDGNLCMVPAPTPYHQAMAGRIEFELRLFLKERRVGEVLGAPCDVYLSQYDVVQPDILYISSDRLGIIKDAYIGGAPDLVVEIVSSSSRERDREVKRKLYARYGVREYWVVDPEARSIGVLTRQEGSLKNFQTFMAPDLLRSPLLAGFQLQLSMIFEELKMD